MDPFEIIMTYGNTKHVDDNNEIFYIKFFDNMDEIMFVV
jgi:hypothetical protein